MDNIQPDKISDETNIPGLLSKQCGISLEELEKSILDFLVVIEEVYDDIEQCRQSDKKVQRESQQ